MAAAAGVRPSERLLKLCNRLTRDIDNALASNYVLPEASSLPSVVKLVYRHGKDTSFQSAVTLLMISIKYACRNEWFHSADADELLQLANELLNSFNMNMCITTEGSNALNTISKIVSRFLPHMKLDRLVVSFEAKVGNVSQPEYVVLMADFLIQKSVTPEETMWLIVVRNDDLQTSSCLITPPSVSFLVNGGGVAGRNNVSLHMGPQFPTDITTMLKYGINIIQAIGLFNGNYTIAIASMSKITSPVAPVLKDYVQPVRTEVVPDSEIIEGSSRISLNCPLSFRRIITPVKGHLCRHHQCFDYGNFMEMNSRKPSWHCPCCNQPTNFMDLRIDQNMVKILQDVTVDINNVVIYPDGSWRVAGEYNRSTDQLHNGTLAKPQDDIISGRPTDIPNAVEIVLDLTMDVDDRGENFTFKPEDRKPFQKFLGVPESSEQPPAQLETDITEGITSHIGDDAWTLSFASALNPSSVPATTLNAQRMETLSSLVNNIILNPVITDATSPSLGQEPVGSLSVNQPISTFQHVSQLGGSILNSEADRQLISRQIMEAPITSIQIPISSSSDCRHSILLDSTSDIASSSPSTSYRAVPSAAAILDEFNTDSGDIEMQHVARTSGMNPDPYHGLNSAYQRARLYAQSIHAGNSFPPELHRVGSNRDSLLPPSDLQSSYHQLLNLRRHQTMSRQSNTPHYSSSLLLTVQHASQNALNVPAGSLASLQYQHLAAQRTAQLTRMQSNQTFGSRVQSTVPIVADTSRLSSQGEGVRVQNMTGGSPTASRTAELPGLPLEQDWRPAGRMRGSLTGSAYSSALNHYLANPSQ